MTPPVDHDVNAFTAIRATDWHDGPRDPYGSGVRDSKKKSGAVAGAVAGLALTAGFCIETWDECGLDVGLLVITPLFALIGAGFGSTQPTWIPVWP